METRKTTCTTRYEDLLARIWYKPEGGQNVPSNAWHDECYYCEDAEVTFERDGKLIGLGRNPYEQLCHSIASKWRVNRWWLPLDIFKPEEREEQEANVGEAIFTCLFEGADRERIVDACFAKLDGKIRALKQDAHKTMPREEILWRPYRAMVAHLFTDLTTVDGCIGDLYGECDCGSLTHEEQVRINALENLFKAAKDAHKYASPEKWLCAQCYALNMPTSEALVTVYGDEIAMMAQKAPKTAKKIVKSAATKYSAHANEVFKWLLEAARDLDRVGSWTGDYEKWLEIAERVLN